MKMLVLYPSFVGSIVILVTFFLMIYLVPQMVAFIKNMGQQIHDRTDERRVENELLHVLGQLVFPFQVLDEAFQHVGEPSRVLTGADQARKDRVENLRILGEALRQPQAALDTLDDSRHYFAKSGIFDAVAQVDQRFDERYPGRDELLHVEAEVNELRALDFARAKEASAVTSRPAPHQVQPHALQTQLEIKRAELINFCF